MQTIKILENITVGIAIIICQAPCYMFYMYPFNNPQERNNISSISEMIKEKLSKVT